MKLCFKLCVANLFALLSKIIIMLKTFAIKIKLFRVKTHDKSNFYII